MFRVAWSRFRKLRLPRPVLLLKAKIILFVQLTVQLPKENIRSFNAGRILKYETRYKLLGYLVRPNYFSIFVDVKNR